VYTANSYVAIGYCNFFQTTASAFIAVTLRAERQAGDSTGAIPTFVVSTEAEVDAWGEKLAAAGVQVTKAAGAGVSSDGKEIAAIYNCMCRDPSGYLIEFQMFRDPAWPR
jgi:predicted lactoylglutathione lyase